jgi:enamine deaminase RidA (YjgF/YER057c/UK114 family)
MSLTIEQTQAIYQLYPIVVTISGDVAYDAQGNVVAYDPIAVQTKADKNSCKAKATQILNATDWTSIADVGDSTKANPYLVNQAEFIAYRSTVRNYAVNPVTNPTFPSAPTEQWSA